MSYVTKRINFIKKYFDSSKQILNKNPEQIQNLLKGNTITFNSMKNNKLDFKFYNLNYSKLSNGQFIYNGDNPKIEIAKNINDYKIFLLIYILCSVFIISFLKFFTALILLILIPFILITNEELLKKLLIFLKLKKEKINKKDFFKLFDSCKTILYHELNHYYDFLNKENKLTNNYSTNVNYFSYINNKSEVSSFFISNLMVFQEKYNIKKFKKFYYYFILYFYFKNPFHLFLKKENKKFIKEKLKEWWFE